MALGGLLGGGGADPFEMYGDLFTDAQKAAIREQQSGDMLARLAAAAAKAAEPSPVKRGFGQVLGLLGGAMGGSQDEAINRQLKAMQLIEEVKSKRQQRGFANQVAAVAQKLMEGGVPAPVANREATRIVEGGGGRSPAAPAEGGDNAPPPPDAVPQPAGSGGGTLETPWSLGVPSRPPGSGWSGTVPSRLPYRGFGAPGGGAAPAAAAEPAPQQQTGLLPPTRTSVGSGWGPGDPGVLPQLAALYDGGGAPRIMNPSRAAELEALNPSPDDPYPGIKAAWTQMTRGDPRFDEEGREKPGTPPFRLAANGPGQAGGLPDVGRVNVEPLSGQARPAGGVEMPFPTIQDPNKPKSAWAQGYTYDKPAVPYGQDPSDRVRPGGGAAPAGAGGGYGASRADTVAYWKSRGMPDHVAQGIADRVGVESSYRSNAIGDNGTSGGLYQHHADRLARLKAFAAAQGKPWTDPDVQHRFAGSETEGGDPQATTGMAQIANAPDRQTAAKLWDRHFERSAAGPGAGTRGLPDIGRVRIEPLGGAAAPAAGGQAVIPGLNMTPEQLAGLNMMAKLGGLGEPFGSLLDTYYKSPAYLAEKARTEATAQKETALKYDPQIEAEKARATQQYIQANEKHKSDLALANDLIGKGVYWNKDTNRMEPIENAAQAMAAIEAAKPTGDIKEYEYYRKQELAAGQIPEPFAKWDASRRKASATTINTAEGFDAAQTKARVGVDAKIAQDLAEQAITGRRLMPILDELAYLADKTPEGWKGPLAITTGRTLAGFGVAVPQGASNAEAFQALAQRLVPVVREPGATSQGEMALYLNAGPSLAGTADGRRLIIDINRSMIQRSQDIAKVYRENIGRPDLYEKLAELDKPLFTPEQRAAMEGATKARAAAPGAPAAPGAASAPTGGGNPVAIGPNGEKLVLSPDGKQWVPQ